MKRDDVVQKWRSDNKDELDRTLAVMVGIRDDPDQKAKDRIDAGRSIARMLGGLAPEREDKKSPPKPEIRSKVEDELERLIEKL
jgi:hypothetical protein